MVVFGDEMKGKVKVMLLSFLSLTLVAGAMSDIKEGNELYLGGKYEEALAKYSAAQTEAPEAAVTYFDIGNVYYRKGQYQKAIDLYRRVMGKEDRKLESSAYYNIGNAKFQLGQPQSSIPIYEEAIENYVRALLVDPEDADAKNNLEYVRMVIEKLKNQEQEEEPEPEPTPPPEEERIIRPAPDIE